MQILSAKIAPRIKSWIVIEMKKLRFANSQHQKGFLGEPESRTRDKQKVAELARSYEREAIETLAKLMRSNNVERVRGTTAQALLERG